MRTLLLGLTTLFISSSFGFLCFAQTENEKQRTNPGFSDIEDATLIYGRDFILKDSSILLSNSSVIYNINVDYLQLHQKIDENHEIIDPNTGLTIILFRKKYIETKSSTNNNIR